MVSLYLPKKCKGAVMMNEKVDFEAKSIEKIHIKMMLCGQ